MATATVALPRERGRAPDPGGGGAPPAGRIPGLDRLRAVALLLMLVHHLTRWFVGDTAILPGWEGFHLTDVAAPAFVLAAGASAQLFVQSRRRREVPRLRVHGLVVRRYGLLVPIGILLHVAVWGDPSGWGVLECLGLAVVIAYAAARLLPGHRLAVAAVVTLAAAPAVEWAADRASGWLANELLGGNFPLVLYTGFALAGYAGARALGGHDRPRAALVLGGVLAAVTVVLIVAGHPPRRYPGGVSFIVPGLAASLLLYGALARWRPGEHSRLDHLLRAAGGHTLGIFLSHYAVFAVLYRTDNVGLLPPAAGAVLAVVSAIAFALAAPHVPVLPWSPRTGWHRRPALSRVRS